MPEQEKRRGESGVCFGSHRVDLVSAQLWRGKQEVKVTGKAFAVLRYFVEHPGQLVSKDDLFAAVWPQTVVSDATLASCIQDLRQALGDKAKKPRYIETVHGRGYRFVAAITPSSVQSSRCKVQGEEGVRGRRDESQAAKVKEPEQETEKPQPVNAGLLFQASALSPEHLPSQVATGNGAQAADMVLSAPEAAAEALRPLLPNPLPPSPPEPVRHRVPFGLVAGGGVLLGVVLILLYVRSPVLRTQPSGLRTDAAPAALPLPDKPSLIVMPFVNLSGDPGQDYFSDGLTEVLTGDLSKISSLFVIARNSAFTYKGKAVKVQDVGHEMGVRYVLEGSVLKAGNQVRITAQLIDTTTGGHIWSERFDRPFTDIFALQDEIVQKIVITLKLQLTLMDQGWIVRKRTGNLEAYDAILRGHEYLWRYTQEANAQARQMFEKAVALDPQYADAYTLLGYSYFREWLFGWSTDPQTLERALALAQQALALDDSLPFAHSLLSGVYGQKQQYDQALAEGRQAIALDPNKADSYVMQAEILNFARRPEEALRMMEQAMRLNPRYPSLYLIEVGWAYNLTGRYAEAVPVLEEAISRSPNNWAAQLYLALGYLGQWTSQQTANPQTLAQAAAAAQRVLALNTASSWGHGLLSYVYLYQKQYEPALAEMERVIALTPNEAGGYAGLAAVLSCVGRVEEALGMVEQALRRNPSGDVYRSIGTAYYLAGRPEEAIAPLKQYLSHDPNFLGAHLTLAAVYSELGREAEAQAEAAEVLRLNPQFSSEVHKQRSPIKDPAVLERLLAALRKAGLK